MGPVPNGSGLKMGVEQHSVYAQPFWNWSRIGQNGSKTGTAFLQFSIPLELFWTGSM